MLLVAPHVLLPLFVGDARLEELTFSSREIGESVLKQRSPRVGRYLSSGDVEVEGAGDAREGRGACYKHGVILVEVEKKVKKKMRDYQPRVFSL